MDNHIDWDQVASNPNMDFRFFDNVPGALCSPYSINEKIFWTIAVTAITFFSFYGRVLICIFILYQVIKKIYNILCYIILSNK